MSSPTPDPTTADRAPDPPPSSTATPTAAASPLPDYVAGQRDFYLRTTPTARLGY